MRTRRRELRTSETLYRYLFTTALVLNNSNGSEEYYITGLGAGDETFKHHGAELAGKEESHQASLH